MDRSYFSRETGKLGSLSKWRWTSSALHFLSLHDAALRNKLGSLSKWRWTSSAMASHVVLNDRGQGFHGFTVQIALMRESCLADLPPLLKNITIIEFNAGLARAWAYQSKISRQNPWAYQSRISRHQILNWIERADAFCQTDTQNLRT